MPTEQSTSYKSAQLFYEFIEHLSMSLKTLKTVFFWMTVVNFLILMISAFGVVMLTQEMKVLHSKIFHISPDKLSLIYFEYLAWYKLLWLIFNLVPYVAMRIMLTSNGTAERSANPSQNAA